MLIVQENYLIFYAIGSLGAGNVPGTNSGSFFLPDMIPKAPTAFATAIAINFHIFNRIMSRPFLDKTFRTEWNENWIILMALVLGYGLS